MADAEAITVEYRPPLPRKELVFEEESNKGKGPNLEFNNLLKRTCDCIQIHWFGKEAA